MEKEVRLCSSFFSHHSTVNEREDGCRLYVSKHSCKYTRLLYGREFVRVRGKDRVAGSCPLFGLQLFFFFLFLLLPFLRWTWKKRREQAHFDVTVATHEDMRRAFVRRVFVCWSFPALACDVHSSLPWLHVQP